MSPRFEKLSVADAAKGDFDENLTGLERGDFEIGQFERAAGLNEDGGGRLHGAILRARLPGTQISPDAPGGRKATSLY
jgi:hypothetical protein